MPEPEPKACDCGRATCIDCLTQFAAVLSSCAMPASRPEDEGGVAPTDPQRLGIRVEDRVGSLDPRDPRTRDHLGALVTAITPRSLGERIGLRVGDLIVAIDGKPTDSATAIHAGLARSTVGRLRVTVRRGAVRLDLPRAD